MQICGPTQSGKSTFASNLIIHSNALFENPIKEVFWFSPHPALPDALMKSDPKTTPVINVFSTLPTTWESNKSKKAPSPDRMDSDDGDDSDNEAKDTSFSLPVPDGTHRMIVIDDYGEEAKTSKAVTALYTRTAHHHNISVVQILQNVFWSGPQSRTRSLNMQYLALMRQTRDFQQIKTLATQLTQSSAAKNAFINAYKDATSRPGAGCYGYLFLSFHPRDDPSLLMRTSIFPNEGKYGTVYMLPGHKTSKKYLSNRQEHREEEEDTLLETAI